MSIVHTTKSKFPKLKQKYRVQDATKIKLLRGNGKLVKNDLCSINVDVYISKWHQCTR